MKLLSGVKLLFFIFLCQFILGCNIVTKVSEKPYNFDSFEIEKISKDSKGKFVEKILYKSNDALEIKKMLSELSNVTECINAIDFSLSGNMPGVKFKSSTTNQSLEVGIAFDNCLVDIYHKRNSIILMKNKEFVKEYLNILKIKCPKEYKYWNNYSKKIGAKGIEDYLMNGVSK